MTKGQIALVSIIGFIVLVAVVLLILAPCLGYSNIIEMFKAWAGNKPVTAPVTPPDTETIGTTLVNFLRV